MVNIETLVSFLKRVWTCVKHPTVFHDGNLLQLPKPRLQLGVLETFIYKMESDIIITVVFPK